MCKEAIDKVFSLVISKRQTSKVITDYKVRGFSKHLNNATKKGATTIMLIGEDELKNNTIWSKNIN